MKERLTVFAGSMFAGKTDELIREVMKEEAADTIVQVFNPATDTRYERDVVRSHSGACHPAKTVENSKELLENVKPDTELVVIDEAQFFDQGLPDVVDKILERGIPVLIGGLSLDFRDEPFGTMPLLLAKADNIARLKAKCTFRIEGKKKCGLPATKTQRIVNGKPASYYDPVVVVGAADLYEARCPAHHIIPDKPKK